MASIRLVVQAEKEGQLSAIYLRLRTSDANIWVLTPEKVFPEYWNNKTQSFRNILLDNEQFTEQNRFDLEQKFLNLKRLVLKEYLNLNGTKVSTDWLKTIINKFYNQKEPGAETLIQYIRRFIDEATDGTRLTVDSSRYRKSTIKNYLSFEVQFLEFCGIYTEKNKKILQKEGKPLRRLKVVNFNDITIDFYKDFVKFFTDKKYSPNTIGRHIKHLKVIMRLSADESLHTNVEYQRKSFKALTEKVDNVYLTEAEIKKIYELDLSGLKSLEIIRDVFLCGCYTAQRFSDYSRITKDMISEDSGRKVIKLTQQKTGEQVIIPIRAELETILNKYDYTLPHTWEQKVNEHIKDIAKLAGIKEKVSFEEKKGGLTVKQSLPKNQLIKTHTARRSGCTNMYLAKIPTIGIMQISGHKTEREFLKYIKVSKQQNADILSSHPYFIGNTLSIAK